MTTTSKAHPSDRVGRALEALQNRLLLSDEPDEDLKLVLDSIVVSSTTSRFQPGDRIQMAARPSPRTGMVTASETTLTRRTVPEVRWDDNGDVHTINPDVLSMEHPERDEPDEFDL